MAKKLVAIDTDFFLKLTEDGKNGELFIMIMQNLHIKPVMHQYVYEEELYCNPLAKEMFEIGELQVFAYEDYLEEADRADYEAAFQAAYKYFNGDQFRENVYTFKCKKRSLGEIRTILMAVYLGINAFMSDDGGAKAYVKSHIHSSRHPLVVYNIYDTCCLLAGQEDQNIKWQELKGMAKRVLRGRQHLYNDLCTIWHKEV